MLKILETIFLFILNIQNNNYQTVLNTPSCYLTNQSLVFVGLAPTTKRVTTQAG